MLIFINTVNIIYILIHYVLFFFFFYYYSSEDCPNLRINQNIAIPIDVKTSTKSKISVKLVLCTLA